MKKQALTRKQTLLAESAIFAAMRRNYSRRARQARQEAADAAYHDDDLDVGRGSNPRPQLHEGTPFCNDGAVAYF